MTTTNDALHFAAEKHAGQVRDEGTPYINHPVAVARILAEYGLDGYEIQAMAYLHDVVEDNPNVDIEDIATRFGQAVANGVELLTKTGESANEYFDNNATTFNTAHVKAADRLHNMRSLLVSPKVGKKQYYAAKTLKYFIPFIDKCIENYGTEFLIDAKNEIEALAKTMV